MLVQTSFLDVKLASSETNSPILFSSSLCRQLNMLQELVGSCLRPIAHIESSDAVMSIVDKFESQGVFKGVGLIKNYKCVVEVDETVRPVSSAPARLPPAILEEVDTKLKQMIDDGIIRKIEEPTDWCSRLVIAKRKSGDLRVCADLRDLNKALKRELFQMPEPIRKTFRISGGPRCNRC